MRTPGGLPIRRGVSNPAFIRTHTDECGKCPDEVDNQGNNAVLPGTALDWTLTTTSRSTLISSRDAHSQISDAGAWRTFEIYCTSKNDDAHRVLADCEDELAVYNAIRNGVKSGELSVEPPRRRASRPGNPGNLVLALPVVFLRYRP